MAIRTLAQWGLILAVLGQPGLVRAQDPLTPSFDYAPLTPGQLQFSADTQYFSSTANYDDEGGSFESLDDEHSFLELNTRLRASYDFGPLTRVFAGGRINYVTTTDEQDTRNNSEFNEIWVGAMYSPVYRVGHRIYLEATGLLALNEVGENDDVAITGEASNRFLLGARYAYLLGQVELLGSLHFDYLQDGRSSRLPFAAGARLLFDKFSIFGSLLGFYSLTEDEFTDDPAERTTITDRVNGGSLRYYAVDPNLLSLQSSLDWALSPKTDLSFGLTKTINGKNAADGFGVLAGLTFRWGGSDAIPKRSVKQRRKRIRRRVRKKPDQDFEAKEEVYDEGLFDDEKKKRKRRSKKRRRRRRPIDVDDAIDSAIEDLE